MLIFIEFISCSHSKVNKNLLTIHLEEGDIIFRKGIGVKSRAVLHVDSTGLYSHSGIIVSDSSVFKVIHISPGERKKDEKVDKIKIESIEEFWSDDKAEKGAIYRLHSKQKGRDVAKQAKRLLKKEILFDHDYSLSDSTQMYCTEFVWYVYLLEGIDISCGKRSKVNMPLYSGEYIFPSDIYINNNISLIYNF